jgi:hypothetical protein
MATKLESIHLSEWLTIRRALLAKSAHPLRRGKQQASHLLVVAKDFIGLVTPSLLPLESIDSTV